MLSANIAVLNAQGTILAVNESWKPLVAANGFTGDGYDVGRNYLHLCNAAGTQPDALHVAGGIQHILDDTIFAFPLGNIALVDKQFEPLFGHSRGEILGQPVEMLIPERFRPNHPAHRIGYCAAPSSRAGTRLRLPTAISLHPTIDRTPRAD